MAGGKKVGKKKLALVRLVSSLDTGYFIVCHPIKNSMGRQRKLTLRKYDPVARKHCQFEERKMK